MNHRLSEEQLLGIGVGSVGPIDRERGIIRKPESFPAPGWQDVPILPMLKEEFSVPVIINNGANTAGLAEYEQRQFFLTKKILYCISGQGIRCGFIHHGVFLDRQEGDASSYGHLIVEANGRTCACGRKGCLSAYTSFNAIFAMIEEAGQQPIHTIEQLVHALECGNQTVKEIVANSAHYYGIGIANMTNILHPDAVILHGKLIYQNEFYFNEVVRSIQSIDT